MDVKTEYRRRKKLYVVFTIVFIASVVPKVAISVFGFSSLLVVNNLLATAIAFVGAAAYLTYGLIFYKCPNCNKYPGNGWSLQECSNCSAKF